MVKNRPLYHAPGSLIGISWLHPAKLIAHPTLTSAARARHSHLPGRFAASRASMYSPSR